MSTQTGVRVEVESLYKIFGVRAADHLEPLRSGADKRALFEEHGVTVAVEDATFAVEPGELFVVMGLSGSGKSTLLRLVNRLIDPTSGHVRIEGEDLMAMSKRELIALRRDRMAMVFQSFALMPTRTVLDNAAFGLEVAGVDRRRRRDRAAAALTEVGLSGHEDSKPHALSGGMQQRVGLARALATDPDLLLMDEAFSALDPLIRTQLQDQLLELQTKRPRTILFISHDLDEAMRLGDRILILDAGRVVQIGTPEQILATPKNDFVRAFFEGVDVLKFYRAIDVMSSEWIADGDLDVSKMVSNLRAERRTHGHVVTASREFLGVVSVAEAERGVLPVDTVEPDTPIRTLIPILAKTAAPVPVVDRQGRYHGAITKDLVLSALEQNV